jgi:hypothetical protein
MTEQQILNAVYALYEGDTENWETTSDEYLAGRVYCNVAINRWERLEGIRWRDLFTTLSAAADGDKTLTAGDYDYDCPSDFRFVAGGVRTIDTSGNSTYFNVIPPEKVAQMDDTSGNWCYFTGSVKDGFILHFNPDLTLSTGHTIAYEYYKSATTFTETTSVSEMSDPYFIVYFVLSRFFENDGEDGKAMKAFQEAEARLDQMRTENMIMALDTEDNIDELNNTRGTSGFGE